jgi:hypothetical protein
MPTSFLPGTQERQQAEDVFLRTYWWKIGQFCAAASKPSKDHQEQASTSLHTNHQQNILFEEPKVLLVAELGTQP